MVVYPAALLSELELTPTPLTHSRILYDSHLRGLGITSVVASDTEETASIDAPCREDTYEYWRGPTLPAYWEVTFPQIRRLDAIGLVGTFGTDLAALTIETSLDGSSYTQFSEEVLPTKNEPLLFLGDEVTATRVRIGFEAAA